MVLWNLLDGGPSHREPLIGPSESMRDGTPSTNPRQGPQLVVVGDSSLTWIGTPTRHGRLS
jgi:hypothetical protein